MHWCTYSFFLTPSLPPLAPQSVRELTLDQISLSLINATWIPPTSRNGSFNISFTYQATQVFIYEERIKRDSGDMNLLGPETNATEISSQEIPNVLPYANYTVTIFGFNRLYGVDRSSESVIMTIRSRPTSKYTYIVQYMYMYKYVLYMYTV